jgi:hypothetical protein
VPLIRSVTGKPVCGGTGVDGVDAGSGVAGWTALAKGAVVASRPTEPSRDRKARREEEPNPEGASVPSSLFLLISSDMVSVFGSRCSGKLVLLPKDSQLPNRAIFCCGRRISILYRARGRTYIGFPYSVLSLRDLLPYAKALTTQNAADKSAVQLSAYL